jgi:hypothetical protein
VLRWRWAAALGASLGAVGEAVHFAVGSGSDPASLVISWWQLILAAVTALATITLVTRPKPGPPPLTWRPRDQAGRGREARKSSLARKCWVPPPSWPLNG